MPWTGQKQGWVGVTGGANGETPGKRAAWGREVVLNMDSTLEA